MAATLTLSVQAQEAGVRCHVRFQDRDETFEFENGIVSPFDADDLAQARWYFEEFPTLRGTTVAIRAATVEARLRQKGAELYVAVLREPGRSRVGSLLADEALLARLQVRIVETRDAPWIPWELMSGPTLAPLCHAAASFVRTLADLCPTPSKPAESGLHLLVVTARPLATEETEDVPFRSISRSILLATAAHPEAGIAVDLLRPPTFEALASQLRKAKAEGRPYDLVHFDGHGEFRASPFQPSKKRGVLLFERDGTAVPDAIGGTALGDLLCDTEVRAVLLNACRSAYVEIGTGRPFDSLAEEVAACGVLGVVAMGFKVGIASAARLFATVYAEIASGASLGEAVGSARRDLTDRPGVREGKWPGILECALPVVYEPEPLRLVPSGSIIALDVDPSRATPITPRVVELGSKHPARADPLPFFARDETILAIERTFRHARVVEIAGLAGSGKSALAAEFARWSVLTRSGSRAVIVDLSDFADAGALRQALQPWEDDLWILEGADRVEWRDEFAALIAGRKIGSTLLTGRASCDLSEVRTIPLVGLDRVERRQLAELALPDLAGEPGFSAFLDWSQGLPGVILAASSILSTEELGSFTKTHAALEELRNGTRDFSGAAKAIGLFPFDPAEWHDTAMSAALYLFQGFMTWDDWNRIAQAFAERGVDFEIRRPEALASHLHLAARYGAVLPLNEKWFALHPLAPTFARRPFYELVGKMGEPAIDLAWWSYLGAVSLSVRMGRTLPERVDGFASVVRQNQNLWSLVESGIRNSSAALRSFPTISILRDVLLDEGRDDEWRSVFERVLQAYRENPPLPGGVDDPSIRMANLLAAEAVRAGDAETVQRFHDEALRLATARTVTVQAVDGDRDKPLIDVTRLQTISALFEKGQRLVGEGLPEGLELLEEASRMSKGDPLREGKITLAIARAYLNVPALRNLERYESFARQSLASTPTIAPAQRVDAQFSVGNAIVTRLQEEGQTADFLARRQEAEALLTIVLHAADATPLLRAKASFALGLLHALIGDEAVGAAILLKSSSLFDEASAPINATVALVESARWFWMAQDYDQARQLAIVAVNRGNVSDAQAPLVAAILKPED